MMPLDLFSKDDLRDQQGGSAVGFLFKSEVLSPSSAGPTR